MLDFEYRTDELRTEYGKQNRAQNETKEKMLRKLLFRWFGDGNACDKNITDNGSHFLLKYNITCQWLRGEHQVS